MSTVFDVDRRLAYDKVRLIDVYEGVFTADEVAQAHDTAREHVCAHAVIDEFVPILTAKMTKQLLIAKGQGEGRMTKQLPEMLFVSESNAGRSHVAAALAKKLSHGMVNVRCAGLHPKGRLDPVCVEVLSERGITLEQPFPLPFSQSLVSAADVVVTMGCPGFCDYVGHRWVEWEVDDPDSKGIDEVRAICDQLAAHVRDLLLSMEITPLN